MMSERERERDRGGGGKWKTVRDRGRISQQYTHTSSYLL